MKSCLLRAFEFCAFITLLGGFWFGFYRLVAYIFPDAGVMMKCTGAFGTGIVFSCLAMAVICFIERRERK
jgi:hypothetical protein